MASSGAACALCAWWIGISLRPPCINVIFFNRLCLSCAVHISYMCELFVYKNLLFLVLQSLVCVVYKHVGGIYSCKNFLFMTCISTCE